MLSYARAAAVLALSLLVYPAIAKATVAVDLTYAAGHFWSNGTVGWRFQVLEPVRVTSLGQYDNVDTFDGLGNGAEVGIYGSDETLLVSAVVPPGPDVELDGLFRFVDVDGPVLLPGHTYTMASVSRDALLLASNSATASDPFVDIFVVDPAILPLGAVFDTPPDGLLHYPTAGDDVADIQSSLYLGPNFRFAAVPEPSTALLVTFGLALFPLVRSKRVA